MSNLEANPRINTSKGSNNILRKQGMVPAILYGGEEKNELISISKKHLKFLLEQENFLSNVLKIKINDRISAYSQFSMNRLVWNNETLGIESVLPPDTINWVTYYNEWAKYFPEVNWIFWYNTQAGISIIFDQIQFDLGKQNHSWGCVRGRYF